MDERGKGHDPNPLTIAIGHIHEIAPRLTRASASDGPHHQGDTGRTFRWAQEIHRGGIGSSRELKRTGRGQNTHGTPKLNGNTRCPSSHITTHRSTIQLPEGSVTGLTQTEMAMPEQPSQLIGLHAVALQSGAHRQAPQGDVVLLEALDQR